MKYYVYRILTNFLKLFLGVLISSFIARQLGPSNKGLQAILITYISLISSYGYTPIVHGFNINYSKNKRAFSSTLNFILIWSFVLCFFIFIGLQLGILNQNIEKYFIIIILAIILNSIYQLLSNASFINRNFKIINYIEIFEKILFLILLWNISENGLTIIGYFIIYLTVLLIKNILVFWFNKNDLNYKFSIYNIDLKNEFNYGKFIFIGALSFYLLYRFDILMLDRMKVTSELIGIYSVGLFVPEKIWIISKSIGRILFSNNLQNKDINKKTDKQVADNNIFIAKISTIIIFMIALFLALFSKFIIVFLYGNEYVSAYKILLIILPSIVFGNYGKIMLNYYVSYEKFNIYIMNSILPLTINIILNFLLIPRFNIYGAAIASSVSYSILGFFTIVYLNIYENFDLSKLFYFNDLEKNIIKNKLKAIKMNIGIKEDKNDKY